MSGKGVNTLAESAPLLDIKFKADMAVSYSGMFLSAKPDLSPLQQTGAGQSPEEEEY